MNPNVAIAYATENLKSANKILQDFKNTSIQFTLVSSKEYTDQSIFSQLEHFQGPISKRQFFAIIVLYAKYAIPDNKKIRSNSAYIGKWANH